MKFSIYVLVCIVAVIMCSRTNSETVQARDVNIITINDNSMWVGMDHFDNFLKTNTREIFQIVPRHQRGYTRGYYILFRKDLT